MAESKCGFDNVPGGASGSALLMTYGPTLMVNIGFDPAYKTGTLNIPHPLPIPGITGIRALVDTGASQSCIDSLLAAQLNLPIVDRRTVSGVHGSQEVNMHLAQVHIPSLGMTIYGAFAGVHLAAGGQPHMALIGRTFLQRYTMVYEGKTGTVTLSD
jgi:predicted aspartyl protease